MTTTQDAIVPRFDDDQHTGRKLAIICSKGNLDMAYPGVTGMATHQLKKSIADLGVPKVPDFLEQIVAAGGHLWAGRLSADMNHLTDADLFEEAEGIISASDFIELTDGAQLLFI